MSAATTYEAAIARALDWAEGRLSHNNALLTAERDHEQRVVTLALIEFADAQEVVKWSAIAAALAAGGDMEPTADEFTGAGCCPQEDDYLRAQARTRDSEADRMMGTEP